MALKVSIKLGCNLFEVDGDFAFDEGFTTAFKTWVNAISETPGQLDSLADRLENQNTQLQAAVEANDVPTPSV